MDAEFILVSNASKISKKYCVLAEKWQFFQRVLKMADLAQNAKGGPFAKFSKSAVFLAELRKVQKIGNTRPLAKSLICVLAEKWQFFQRVLKMADLAQNAKGGPFAKFSIFLAELRKVQKIGNTRPILA